MISLSLQFKLGGKDDQKEKRILEGHTSVHVQEKSLQTPAATQHQELTLLATVSDNEVLSPEVFDLQHEGEDQQRCKAVRKRAESRHTPNRGETEGLRRADPAAGSQASSAEGHKRDILVANLRLP